MHSERPFELFSTTHIGIIFFLAVAGMSGIWYIRQVVPKTRLHMLELFFAFWVVLQFSQERIAYLYVEAIPGMKCFRFSYAALLLSSWHG